MNASIDFIGDIHGHYDELVVLLKKLGYEERGGAFRYPGDERTVVFLGDYIDRGSQVRETVNLVRAMRDAGLSDEIITSMLQKHWDLRQSEAASFIDWAHSRVPEKLQMTSPAAVAPVR